MDFRNLRDSLDRKTLLVLKNRGLDETTRELIIETLLDTKVRAKDSEEHYQVEFEIKTGVKKRRQNVTDVDRICQKNRQLFLSSLKTINIIKNLYRPKKRDIP